MTMSGPWQLQLSSLWWKAWCSYCQTRSEAALFTLPVISVYLELLVSVRVSCSGRLNLDAEFDVSQVPFIVNTLWDALLDLDDLTASTNSIMTLLSSLLTYPQVRQCRSVSEGHALSVLNMQRF